VAGDRDLQIVVVQGSPVPWDPAATIAKLEAETRRLCAWYPDTKLVVHPEYYVTGFTWASDAPPGAPTGERLAEAIPGPLTERLARLAADLRVWLIPGTFYERGEDGIVYNTAVALSPDGEITARYRKVFPWRPWETVAAGSDFVVFDIDGIGRAGLMTCYDGWFPEVSRQLAWMGAEVIFQPGATFTSDRPQELVLARANAITNQLFVVNANTAAPAGSGRSLICDPEGHPLQVAEHGEAYLTEVLDLDAVDRVREHGSVGLNRLWQQLDREGGNVRLPMYDGAIAPRPGVGVSRSFAG
jgi:formamidase